jgi:hypothetical protein
MTAQKDYYGFFSDLKERPSIVTPQSKPSKNDSFDGFFEGRDQSDTHPSLANDGGFKGDSSTFFSDLDMIPQQNLGQEEVSQPIEASKEPGFLQRAKDYFKSGKLGEAAVMQMKSGGFSGAPALEPKVAKKVATEVGTIAVVEAAFAPIIGLAHASKVAPRVLTALTRLTQAGTTGAATVTTGKLVEEGQLPTQEELVKDGLTWMAIDAIMQGLHLTASAGKKAFDFGKAVNNIAKEEGVPATTILNRLWTSTKNYLKQRYGKVITTPEDISPQDVDLLIEKAKEAEEKVSAPSTKVPASEKPSTPSEKLAEEKLPIEQQREHVQDKDLFGQIKAIAAGEPSLDQSQAKWVVDEMKNAGNDLTKLQDVIEKMPTMWSETKQGFAPVKRAEETEATQPLAKKIKQPRTPERQPKVPVIGKKQAVARSQVMNLFRKAFKDPLVIGKKKMTMKQASGEHHLWSRISRLVKDNDIETAAHEIGHNLHTMLYGGSAKAPKEQAANIHRALRPYLDELKPLALYEPYGMEGFAEFARMYVTNPEVARKLAPKFYDKFEADMGAQYPDLKNALLEARDYYDQYLQGTPESRIRAQTNYGEDASRLDNLTDWVKENLNLDKLKTNFLDDVFPAKRVVSEAFGIPLSEVENLKDPRNLYRSLRVLKGSIGKADVFLTHETFDAKTLKRKGRGLRQILRKLKTPEEYKGFNDYLIARRAVEKAGQGVETGINLGDAVVTEKNLAPKYKRLAILLDHYNDALLSYAKDSGLISEEQYSMIKKNNLMYAPFQRVTEREAVRNASAAGKLQAGRPIKRMKGSPRDIIAPVESVIKNTYSIIVNSEKNLSGQVLAKLAKMQNVGPYVHQVPTPMELKGKVAGQQVANELAKEFDRQGLDDLISIGEEGQVRLRENIAKAIPEVFLRFGPGTYPAGEKIVTVFHDGKPSYYEVSPEIYEMWAKGIAPYTADIITRILRIPARTLRAGAILNPKFQLKNFVRDTWGGFLFTKYGKTLKDPTDFFIDTIYAPLAQLSTAAKQSKLYVEWMKAGGGMSTMQSLDRGSVAKKLKEVRDGLSPLQVIKWLRKVSEISEEGNRLAEFSRAMAVEEQTRLGKEISAFASRDLSIDFAKMGLQTKALNQIIPFWNATVQGGDKLFRTLASDKDKADFLARAVGFILVPSLILAWLNQDDERVKEFYEEEKDFNFITFIGGTALKIPVPFETGVLVHGLTQRMYNFFMKKDPHAFEGFMGSIVSAMLPSFIPALANPAIEVAANKNFFTGAPIIPRAKEGLISKYQYKNNTSATARLIGRAMAYMLGQDTRSRASSPAVIDHFINSWGAGLGRTIVSILDEGLVAAGLEDRIPGPEKTITEKLGLDAFVARYPRSSTRSIEKFYDYYADATARQKSIKHAEKIELEEPEEIKKAYERVDRLYDYPTLKRGYRAIQQSQKAINEIWHSPDIDPETKKKMIDELYLQQIQFAKAAVEDIEKYRLSMR